jgi:hypothetical protein
MRTLSIGRTCAWSCAAIAAVCVATVFLTPAAAQTCEDNNPLHAVALLGRLEGYCERGDVPYTFDLYGLASVAGEQAVPMLRKIAEWSNKTAPGKGCERWMAAARLALAKLGDEPFRSQLDLQMKEPKSASAALASLSIVGDDRALLNLIDYLIEHAEDPAMYHNFGDYGSDTRPWLLEEIEIIGRRRRVPDLPRADYSRAGILEWKRFVEKHRGQQVTFPVYPDVANAYLQCLARRVEWGYPDAILAIAASGEESAGPILRRFPQARLGDAMGFVAMPGSLLDHPGNWANIQGNVQVSLARFGDSDAFDQIVAELGTEHAFEAVRKLEFIGGKRAVDALIHALDVPEALNYKLQRVPMPPRIWRPMWKVMPAGFGAPDEEVCAPYSAKSFQGCLVGVVSLMLKNPPLPSNAKASAENVQMWKDWWAKNKDQAMFSQRPAQSFE